MTSYKAHFLLDSGVSFTMDVQFELKHHSAPEPLYAEMEKLANRLGAQFSYVEYVLPRERRKEQR